jgi:hypothetical protein
MMSIKDCIRFETINKSRYRCILDQDNLIQSLLRVIDADIEKPTLYLKDITFELVLQLLARNITDKLLVTTGLVLAENEKCSISFTLLDTKYMLVITKLSPQLGGELTYCYTKE